MSLPHIILTQLRVNGEMTGYEITVAFKGNAGLAWRASHQQVYRELGKLEAAGFCFHRLEPQEGKPDRKVFSITIKGEKMLSEWRKEKVPVDSYRDKMSAKVFVSRKTNHKDLIAVLREEIEEANEKIMSLDQAKIFDVIDEVLRDRRLFQITAHRDWARDAIAKLEAQ